MIIVLSAAPGKMVMPQAWTTAGMPELKLVKMGISEILAPLSHQNANQLRFSTYLSNQGRTI